MAIKWGYESCDMRDDPVSGARIIQLTSAAAISNNIYGEQPYTSPDGKRIVIARCQDFCWDEEGSILVHELDTLRITMVVKRMRGVRGVFNAAWSGLVYYWTPDRKLMRLSLMTLEQEEIYAEEDPDAFLPASSVSPDQRYIIGMTPRLKGKGSPIFQIVRFDLKEKKREVILEHEYIHNPHLQFNPVHGREILVQNNRGWKLQKDGSIKRPNPDPGTTLFVINNDGSNLRYVPVGPPITSGCTGHECFVRDTGKVLFSTSWVTKGWEDSELDSRFPQGNIFTARPGDEEPVPFIAPEHRFNHVCVSRCGKYFVADSHAKGGVFYKGHIYGVSLVIGNLETGKYRVIVEDTQSWGGGNQCTHTHPYLTADNRYVIYNANPGGGIAQVFAAKIPEGFLESLS